MSNKDYSLLKEVSKAVLKLRQDSKREEGFIYMHPEDYYSLQVTPENLENTTFYGIPVYLKTQIERGTFVVSSNLLPDEPSQAQ